MTVHRRQIAARRVVAVAASVALALLGGECLLRLVGAPELATVQRGRLQLSANPRLIYEPVPALSVAGQARGLEIYPGTSNSLGYRDREHARAKPDGVFRVVVIGDSIATGHGIERTEDVFPALVEAALADAARPVEVLNFGVIGYNTAQEVETLRAKALAFAPDLVLLEYCLNDRLPPEEHLIHALLEVQPKHGALPPTELAPLLRRSALYRFLRYALLDFQRDEEVRSGGDTSEAALRELARLARRGRFQVLLVVFPYLHNAYAAAYAADHARLEFLSAELGFRHLDLRPVFRDCAAAQPAELGFDRFHPTVAGHRCAAAAIASAVRSLRGNEG